MKGTRGMWGRTAGVAAGFAWAVLAVAYCLVVLWVFVVMYRLHPCVTLLPSIALFRSMFCFISVCFFGACGCLGISACFACMFFFFASTQRFAVVSSKRVCVHSASPGTQARQIGRAHV